MSVAGASVERLRKAASEPRDIASLAAFRVLFGVLMLGSVSRYFVYGWIDTFYVQPTFTFQYYGFGWVRPLPAPAMYALFGVLGVAAAMIALGLLYRWAAAVFFVGFAYVALLDVTRYLNHYYLAVLFGGLLLVLPLHRAFSLDARRDPSIAASQVPAWMLWLVRFQVGVVYVCAGLAKVNSDWLFYAQPLGIWLTARTETPLFGPLFEHAWVHYLMSWTGCLYDLTIVFWLSWRRTRPYAFVVLCVFHLVTHLLFNIGIFPLIMTVAATVYFEPDWPRRCLARLVPPPSDRSPAAPTSGSAALPLWGLALLAGWVAVQALVPLRPMLYGGNVQWHEQGMRWGWRVMLHEKNGDVMYRVRFGDRETRVPPRRYLTHGQEREFAAQPDLILQLAHRIRDDFRERGHEEVEVRVDAYASLNGRRSARLIDPAVDLARVEDGLGPAEWILPAPDGPPARSRGGLQLAGTR